MDLPNRVCLIVVICFSCLIIGYQYGTMSHRDTKENNVIVNDTTYNKVVLDSISYNIVLKDSIVYKLKVKMKDDVEKAIVLGDSASVKLFKELVECK